MHLVAGSTESADARELASVSVEQPGDSEIIDGCVKLEVDAVLNPLVLCSLGLL